jgi:DNA-binding beta-propeller fold protein YncE
MSSPWKYRLTNSTPSSGLDRPFGVAVDSTGNVYVIDHDGRLVELVARSNTQQVVPFTGLSGPVGVAVDFAGNVYASDTGHNRVVKLTAG